MSDVDRLPTIPKRARTAVKRPDLAEMKNRLKGKMNHLNLKTGRGGAAGQNKSEKEQEVAEALYDLANLAGTVFESSPEEDQLVTMEAHGRKGARGGKFKGEDGKLKKGGKGKGGRGSDGEGNGMRRHDGMGQRYDLGPKGKGGKGDAPKAGDWPPGIPRGMNPQAFLHPTLGQNIFSQIMGYAGGFPPQAMPQAVGRFAGQGAIPPPVKAMKRCAHHIYIAHWINYQQMMQQANLMHSLGVGFGGPRPSFPQGSAGFPPGAGLPGQAKAEGKPATAPTGGEAAAVSASAPQVQPFPPQNLDSQGMDVLKAQMLLQNPFLSMMYPLSLGMPPGASNGAAENATAGQNPAASVPPQMQQFASQLQSSLGMGIGMQPQVSFPMTMPPGQFQVPPFAPPGGLPQQQMNAFLAAVNPAMAFGGAGGMQQNAPEQAQGGAPASSPGTGAAAAEKPPAGNAANADKSSPPNPFSQLPGAQHLLSAAMQSTMPPQFMGSQAGPGDPQAAAAAAAAMAAQLLSQQPKMGHNVNAALAMLQGVDVQNGGAAGANHLTGMYAGAAGTDGGKTTESTVAAKAQDTGVAGGGQAGKVPPNSAMPAATPPKKGDAA